jgi:hypothetical protein
MDDGGEHDGVRYRAGRDAVQGLAGLVDWAYARLLMWFVPVCFLLAAF